MWNLPDDKWTNEYDDEAETLVKICIKLSELFYVSHGGTVGFPMQKRTFPDAET